MTYGWNVPDTLKPGQQTVETVPFDQVKRRILDLNNELGYKVLSISVDREHEQMWLLIEKVKS